MLNAILVTLVDEQMVEDCMVKAVADLLGVRWHVVKAAVLRRIKLDDEEAERPESGAWQRVPRSTRCECDNYALRGYVCAHARPRTA